MRNILGNSFRNSLIGIAVAMLPAAAAVADPLGNLKLDPAAASPSDKPLPLKRTGTGNACAALGPGFVKVDGTDTCIEIGGMISVGAGGSSRSR
jgi:hypothetical protein